MARRLELMQCPFCGEQPELKDHRLIWSVECKCGATVIGDRAPEPTRTKSVSYWNKFEQSAIDKWNARVGVKN